MKKIFSMLILTILSLSIMACGKATNGTQSTAVEKDSPLRGEKSDKYVMVTFVSGIGYWKDAFRGMEDAANNLGVEAQYTGANGYDINQEVTVLEQVIAKKPKGIILTCINPNALKEPINKAIDKGIPVVTFDADSPQSKRYSFVGTSNFAAGETAAREMAKLVGGKGEVAIISLPGQLNHEERIAGFVKTIEKEFPKMKVVSVQDGKADQVIAAQVTGAIIQANPNLVGVFVTEASGGVGVASGIREARKTGKIKVISFDTEKGTLDAIKNDEISATIAQGTYNMGYWSMMFVYHLANDLLHPIKGDHKAANINPLPDFVDTGVNIVTKENVEFFY